jgi:multiple sugar transport system permease protein
MTAIATQAAVDRSMARAMRPRKMRLSTQRRVTGFVLAVPALALVIAFVGVPLVQAAYYSFTEWNGVTSTWIGLSAYEQVFSDTTFWQVITNNALLLLAVPFALAIPLAIAVLLHERVRGWKLFRSIYFLPTAISWVVIGMVAERFFAYQGPLDKIVGSSTDWLGDPSTALFALAVTFVWSMIGTNVVIFLTGLATLDTTVQEAAFVDGATAWQSFCHVTLPHLKRFVQLSFVLTVISAFSALFSLIFVMTGGGPGYSTTTLEFFVYQTGFSQSEFGTAALYGIILFVMMAVIGIVQLRVIRAD